MMIQKIETFVFTVVMSAAVVVLVLDMAYWRAM
jgi:hypothetical protein